MLLGDLDVGHCGSCFFEFGCSVLKHSECYARLYIKRAESKENR